MHLRKLTLLVLLVFISACSESSVFTNAEGTDQGGATQNNTPIEFQGPNDYDFSLYFFHANTRTTGGEVTFTEKYYEKPAGSKLLYSRVTRHLNTGTYIESIDTNNAVLLQYLLTINSIKPFGVSYDGAETITRYIELGEGYLDSIVESLGRRDTCTLQNHLDEFDLSEATGAANLATGVYEDVLHVFCKRVLDTDNGGTNYSWNAYYAKDVGIIFADGAWTVLDSDGNWLNIGDAYLIPEY